MGRDDRDRSRSRDRRRRRRSPSSSSRSRSRRDRRRGGRDDYGGYPYGTGYGHGGRDRDYDRRDRGGPRPSDLRTPPDDVYDALIEREKSRLDKNFKRSDEIRDALRKDGWEVYDRERCVRHRGDTYYRPNANDSHKGDRPSRYLPRGEGGGRDSRSPSRGRRSYSRD